MNYSCSNQCEVATKAALAKQIIFQNGQQQQSQDIYRVHRIPKPKEAALQPGRVQGRDPTSISADTIGALKARSFTPSRL
ncbi:MAG: hypothetical protein CMI65_00270 [Pedosphaera sp.]|nr:hypothetical protein [Pedosphaera sp.]HCQ83404.1 hypothetical protein [Verrucomicrobiales bacterium]